MNMMKNHLKIELDEKYLILKQKKIFAFQQTTPAKCTSTNVNIIGDGYCNPATNTAG